MVFQEKELLFRILGVYKIVRKNVKIMTDKKASSVISYRCRGSATFHTSDHSFTLGAGDLLFIPANLSYTQETAGEELIAVHLDILSRIETNVDVCTFENPQLAEKIFTELYELWQAKETGYHYRCMSLLYDFLCRINQQNRALEAPSAPERKIQRSLTYLHSHYDDNTLSIGKIAAVSGVSEVYFRRLFKQIYQTTPVKYINELRITKSLSLLKIGYYSVAQISSMVGFNDPKYFCSSFKALTGKSPTAYQKQEEPYIC